MAALARIQAAVASILSSKNSIAEGCRSFLGGRRQGRERAASSRLPTQPLRIESKNSALLLVALILSSKNSIASRSSIGYRSLRKIQTF